MKTVKYLCDNCNSLVSVKEDIKECPNCSSKLFKRNLIKNKTKLRNIAWVKFSRYIRVRDCLKTTGNPDVGKCYTCGEEHEINKLQAGHMVDGRSYDVLFDENFVNAQCYRCNMPKSGKQGLFVLKKIEELQSNGKTLEESYSIVKSVFYKDSVEYTLDDIANVYFEYKKKLDELT